MRAENIYGWGPFSPIVTILAAQVPSQVATPTTSIDPTTGGLAIQWTQPSSGGITITSYQILIANAAGTTWTADTTDCNGASATVIANLHCIIPMSVLTAAPYSYTFG